MPPTNPWTFKEPAMFELDHDLAQDIVDRAMAILPYNVNVMDSQGLILGLSLIHI